MNIPTRSQLAAACGFFLLLAACKPNPSTNGAATESKPTRIVSIGGSATEILFALGAGPQVVAVDQSSTWPPEATRLPLIGYIRVINPEGVLAANPTLIVTTSDLGPPEAATKLASSGTPILKVQSPNSPEAVADAITEISEHIGKTDEGQKLRSDFEEKMRGVATQVAKMPAPLKVALFMNVEGSSFNAAGADTKADVLVRLAGGENAFGSFSGYKPVSAEAVVAAAPDVILIATTPDRVKAAEKSIIENPALSTIPARKNQRVLVLDLGAALNFGPRLADSTLALAEYLAKTPAAAPTAAEKP